MHFSWIIPVVLIAVGALAVLGCRRISASGDRAARAEPTVNRPIADDFSGDIRLDITVDQRAVAEGAEIEVDLGGRTIKVRLPKGIVPGTIIRARGAGNPARDGGNGIVYLYVRVGKEMVNCKRLPVTPDPK
jgi:nitrous oxidase accessory protein NosD